MRNRISFDHHHHVTLPARISLTLSCHTSLSSIAPRRSSSLYPVLAESCCMQVLAGRPALARPYKGVHRSMSLMSSSLLLQECLACLVRLTWIIFVMGSRWPYSCCFVGCCLLELFKFCHLIMQKQHQYECANKLFPVYLEMKLPTLYKK